MKKWLETLALITLVIILRLLVNFLFPEIPYWGRFLLTVILGVLVIVSLHFMNRKIRR
ncbi:hypothetical protein SMIM3IV_00042 [Streptococcus mitis]|uniref:Uncharacterized protein n=1 Tax=Streptococcus mitis TaxID=28037 RepID=A0A0F2DS90_STRMT|nr:hypothetical protein TZ93_01248 [Streptococcus mitis]KYF35614.1 hypothetical protein SMIM3IV_00042 [Streptococcus mitis]KYF38237.1 hypothetical protein SMIM3I_00047 [Streptococcus mitis]